MRLRQRFKETISTFLQDKNSIDLFFYAFEFMSFLGACISFFISNESIWTMSISILILSVILLSILYKISRNNSIILKGLFRNNVPMVSTVSYLMNSMKRKEFNNIDIETAHIIYRFKSPDSQLLNAIDKNLTDPGDVFFDQEIYWRFRGSNNTKKAIKVFDVLLSKSVFSSFQSWDISAYDNSKKSNLLIQKGNKILGLQRYIHINFYGEGIESEKPVDFTLKLKKNDVDVFRNVEYFIIDPYNYSLNVRYINVCVISDIEDIKESVFKLIQYKRNSFKEVGSSILNYNNQLCYTCQDCTKENIIITYQFRPKRQSFYLLEITLPNQDKRSSGEGRE